MNAPTVQTGILVDFRKGYNGIGNINLAACEFAHQRDKAVATEIHVHPQTIKDEGIDPATVKRLTGLKLVADKGVRERRIQVISLEGV
jgi:hypothetical protein